MPPTTETTARTGLRFDGYRTGSTEYDEYRGADGQPRAHWAPLSGRFEALGEDEWIRRRRQLDKLIHDYGITYNVYGEDSATGSPWALDMLPHCLPQDEMQRLESMLSQRAHLLNLVLEDVYGRQTMLQSGRMDPYLVFANPSFHRCCHGLLPPRRRHIQLYAADVARAPDGNWWVLADRVEAASGLGYSLENRSLMARLFPRIMAESGILSLQPFIHDYCRHIEALVPPHVDQPNIALLTAGPHNETYFEQSFLARNLGFHLVEGGDMTVRNNRLYTKTVAGVQPVDVLLRRIDTEWCDPLELRNDSLLGVPGLVNAVRQGNLTVANALGSGFVETTAMLAFLPWFCRNFLGEALEMPSVATWWCGQKKERDYVIANLERLVIKPTFWSGRARSIFGPHLSAAEREAVAARIRHSPEQFCGQEMVSHSTLPAIGGDGGIEARHFQMRVFLIPEGAGWKIMPGGLVRYGHDTREVIVSLQQGGTSKDAWILREGPPAAPPPADTSGRPLLRRTNQELPSRTADNLFWMGRYLERAESQARLVRAACNLLLDEAGSEHQRGVLPFMEQLASTENAEAELFDPASGALLLPETEATILAAIFDPGLGTSLVATLASLERAAGRVKERLSADIWKCVIAVAEMIDGASGEGVSIFDDQLIAGVDAVLDNLAQLVGNLDENMTRTVGWRFLQAGRRIERGLAISNLLAGVAAFGGEDEVPLEYLLIWADSSITYRRRYLNALRHDRVLEILCFDATNPRSLAYQCAQLQQLLSTLPHSRDDGHHPIDRCTLRLNSRIGLCSAPELASSVPAQRQPEATDFYHEMTGDLAALAVAIEEHYFAHTGSANRARTAPLSV